MHGDIQAALINTAATLILVLAQGIVMATKPKSATRTAARLKTRSAAKLRAKSKYPSELGSDELGSQIASKGTI